MLRDLAVEPNVAPAMSEGVGPSPAQSPPMSGKKRGALSAVASVLQFLIVAALIGGLGFVAGGFLRFVEQVEAYDIASSESLETADAIVVLTGGPMRLEASGDLLKSQRARHLLVSGVNLRTTEPQVRSLLDVNDDLFSCCVELGFEARDTRGNAREGASWFARLTDEESGPIGGQGSYRLILVTSNYHMQRSLHEFRRLLPQVELVPHAVRGLDMSSPTWWREAGNWRLLLGEYGKLLLARSRDYPAISTVLDRVLAKRDG